MRTARTVHDVGVGAQRVGKASVLGQGTVGQIELLGIELFHLLAGQRRHVLDDRPGHRKGGSDDRLGVLVQVDELGVAAALVVRNTVLRPGVLVVADQLAVGVGGEGRLAGPRKAEQDRAVPALADVGRAMHRHLAHVGQEVVHHGEHGLLDHTAVVGAANDESDLVLEVHDDRAARRCSVALGITVERGHVQHRPAPLVLVRNARNALGEHVVGEHGVGGVLPHEAVRNRVGGIPTAEDILDVQRRTLLVEMRHDALQERLVLLRIELLVVLLPPHRVLDLGPGYTEGVLDRTGPCRWDRCSRRAGPSRPASWGRPSARHRGRPDEFGRGRGRSPHGTARLSRGCTCTRRPSDRGAVRVRRRSP